jgi:hypothetical protein
MRRLLLIAVALGAASTQLRAETPKGTSTEAEHTFERAGFPNVVAPWAIPSQTPKKALGIIGGSVAFGGAAPVARTEGTIGYDYVGFGPPGRVFLGWGHDPVYPRPGTYRTDGPRVFDVFSIHPLRKALSPGEGSE